MLCMQIMPINESNTECSDSRTFLIIYDNCTSIHPDLLQRELRVTNGAFQSDAFRVRSESARGERAGMLSNMGALRHVVRALTLIASRRSWERPRSQS